MLFSIQIYANKIEIQAFKAQKHKKVCKYNNFRFFFTAEKNRKLIYEDIYNDRNIGFLWLEVAPKHNGGLLTLLDFCYHSIEILLDIVTQAFIQRARRVVLVVE